MSLHQFILALRAKQRVFLMILASTVLFAVVVSLVMPKTYVSTVSLLVDRRDEQSLAGVGGATRPREQLGYLQTQADIITSRRVARKVVDDLKLADDPKVQARFKSDTDGNGTIQDWLAQGLLRTLTVDTSQSSVIQVQYKASDAQFASDVANAFAKAYTETALELRNEPSREAAAWFTEQLKDRRKGLDEAQNKLAAFQKEKGIFAADERYDVESTRMGELSTQLLQAQSASYEAAARRRQAQDSLGRGQSLDALPEVLAHPFIQGLKTDLLRGEARLQEMSTHLGSAHPQYQRQVSEVKSLRDKLSLEMSKIARGLESQAAQAQSREAEIRNALAAQRAQVLGSKQARSEIAALQRDVETQQRIYDSAMQRYAINKVDSQARQTNITTLNAAAPPNAPQSPKLALNFLLALVVGSMLGLGTVYMTEALDPRVRSRGDLESQLNLPLLGVLDDGQSSAGRRLLPPGTRSPALPKPAAA